MNYASTQPPKHPSTQLPASRKVLGYLGLWVFGCFAATSPLHAQEAEKAPAPETTDAPELTEAADLAIERGLTYLLATQNPDGSWSAEGGAYEIGSTSLDD